MLIGLFGGTFDPPHLGHLALCREAVGDLSLDRLLWVLTPDPPHKRHRRITPLDHRLAMVEIALQGTSFELSRVDLDRPAPHYAVDSVKILAAQNPKDQLIYLMGSDSLNDLPTWHHARELVTALEFIGVMHRVNELPDLSSLDAALPGLSKKVFFVQAPRVDVSASEIRLRVRSGRPISHLVTPGVETYIREHNLYSASTPAPAG